MDSAEDGSAAVRGDRVRTGLRARRVGRRWLAAALAVAMGSLAAAQEVPAQQPGPVVVELYTSQGCSACPPADELLTELAERDDVIALALHVDYWNYLGWADTLSAPGHAKRQKLLASAMGERMIYTPQAVIDGVRGVVGSDREAVEAAIAEARARDDARPVTVTMTQEGDLIRARAQASRPVTAMLIYMVYDHPVDVAIGAGENGGMTVTYVNAVRALMPMGRWTGAQGAWSLPAPQDARGAALLLQEPGGRIIGAARIEFETATD
ncbi:MAG: DUF1223 domain-containing protein [Rubrimonas sp.]